MDEYQIGKLVTRKNTVDETNEPAATDNTVTLFLIVKPINTVKAKHK